MLRIEDTDRTRLVPGSAEKLEEALCWAGIGPDESPLVGGEFGPYKQSERQANYKTYTDQLLASGHAYRCFCSEVRLELLKKEAARARQVNKYDRKCLFLSEEELQEKLATKTPYTVRFKLTPHPEPFTDLVYGQVTHDVFEQEGDPILVKSDGFPTYHLANVVDDYLMQISHVLRGSEWQVSTPKHLLLYRALGWQPPSFAHLPLILNKDGSKLSKRQGDLHIDSLRRAGFYSDAVINFVSLVGGGFEDKVYSLENIFNKNELVDRFKLSKMNTSSGRLEMERLDGFNRLVLKQRLSSDTKRLETLAECRQIITKASFEKGFDIDNVDDETIEKHLKWAEERIVKLTDIASDDFLFLWLMPRHYSEPVVLPGSVIKRVVVIMNQETFKEKSLLKHLRQLGKEENIKFSQLMKDLRVLITGKGEGPPITELLQVLGTKTVVKRLNIYLQNR